MSWDELYRVVTEFNTNMPTAVRYSLPRKHIPHMQPQSRVFLSSMKRGEFITGATTNLSVSSNNSPREELCNHGEEEIERLVTSQGYDEVTDIIQMISIDLKCLIFGFL